MNNSQLYITEILAGKKHSYIPLIEFYEEKLYQTAVLLENEEKQAEQMVIDCFVHVYKKLPDYDGSVPFSEWFVSAAFPFLLTYSNRKNEQAPINRFPDPFTTIEKKYRELPEITQHALLLAFILESAPQTIQQVLQLSEEERKETISSGKWELLDLVKTIAVSPACIPIQVLFRYDQKIAATSESEKIDNHLEFCPQCRSHMQEIKQELNRLAGFFLFPRLSETLEERVLQNVKPFQKQRPKKSLTYQLFAVIGIVALFSIAIVIMPTVQNWTKLASNYVKYGELYNVWPEGTYVTTDRDISVEFTNIDISPILLKLDFKIDSERDLSKYTQHLTNGGFSLKIDEEVHPISVQSIVTPKELTEGSIYLDINSLHEIDIPDEFILHFNTMRVAGIFGGWNMEIPIDYKNGLKKIETIPVHETVMIDDKIKVDVETFTKSQTGSKINFEIDFTNIEKERKQANYDKQAESGKANYFDPPRLIYESRIVNQNGEVLMPIMKENDKNIVYWENAWEYFQDPNPIYLNYFVEPDSNTLTRPLQEKDKLYFELDDIQFTENILLDLPIELEEVDNAPLSLEYNGTAFENLTIKRLEAMDNKPERYEITVKGSHGGNDYHVKKFYWVIENAPSDYYLDQFGQAAMSAYQESPYEDPNTLFSMEIPIVEDLPKQLELKSYNVTNYYRFDESVKVPLFKE